MNKSVNDKDYRGIVHSNIPVSLFREWAKGWMAMQVKI